MKIIVVGAGAAGLAVARRLKEENFEFFVFEQSDKIGGTWVYDDRTGQDEYGLPIHSSMYQNLRTNLPKEVMGFPDFPITCEDNRSYLRSDEILTYLNQYADHFEIRTQIKFRHCVRSVERAENRWKVSIENLLNKETNFYLVDSVIVCNGHYNTPFIPTYVEDRFRKRKMHSHDYKSPKIFEGETVVVVGAGPSGMDIALDITSQAKQVILSHHTKEPITVDFPPNLIQKPDVVSLKEEEVIFQDGSKVKVDTIFYCTGYRYNFPFLKENCGVKVVDNWVTPLYKHLISVENPTLCLIGLPYYVCAFSMFDLQIRFFIKYLKGQLILPSREEMLEDELQEMNKRKAKGLTKRQAHLMGFQQQDYYDQLAAIAKVQNIPLSMSRLHNESSKKFQENLVHYRNDKYKIINDFDFILLK